MSDRKSIIEDNIVFYQFKDSELINKVEFTLKVPQPYNIESSIDFVNWTQVGGSPDMVSRGRQAVYFKKTKMKYLSIKLMKYMPFLWINVEDSDVVAVLDTTR